MRKWFGAACACVFALSLVVGCGSKTEPTTPPVEEKPKTQPGGIEKGEILEAPPPPPGQKSR